jgi:predicted ester cyclase
VSVETNKSVVRRFTEECWGLGNLELVDELVAADAVAGHGAPGAGPDAYKAEISQVRTGIGEYETIVDEVFGENDLVGIRWTTTGRHTGSLFGFAPTGRPLRIVGADIFRVRNGKIVEHWGESAVPMVLAQIGAFQAPVPT